MEFTISTVKFNGSMEHTTAIIDDNDIELAAQFKWRVRNGYMHTTYAADGLFFRRNFHHMLVDTPAGMLVDHINGNKLDNRRSNLRVCTQQENCRNRKKMVNATSEYKGVSLDRGRNQLKVAICVDGKVKQLGIFSVTQEKEAAELYDKYAKLYFGSFAKLNFPEK